MTILFAISTIIFATLYISKMLPQWKQDYKNYQSTKTYFERRRR